MTILEGAVRNSPTVYTVLHISIKGIVSRDFGGLQMILMDRIGAPDVSLEVYSFLNFRFHIFFKFKDLSGLNKGLSLFYVKK